MKYINSNIMVHAVVSFIATFIFFKYFTFFLDGGQYAKVVLTAGLYGTILFLSGLLNGWKNTSDPLGIKVHLATFIICLGTPIVLSKLSYLPQYIFQQSLFTMAIWNLLLCTHVIICIYKRRI